MAGNYMEMPFIKKRPTKRPGTPSTIPTVVRFPYSRPSGVRRSIHSSASARVMSLSGLPRRFSRRSTPFSPRHSTASVFSRSTWLLRALPAPPLLEEGGFSACPFGVSCSVVASWEEPREEFCLPPRMGVGLPREGELWETGGASSPSESSSRAVAPTFTASRKARAFARVSAIRIRCGTMLRPTFSGLASPIPEKRRPSSISAVALTIATLPFASSGTWTSSVSMPLRPRLCASSSNPANRTYCLPCLVIMNSSLMMPLLASFPNDGLPIVFALEGDPIAHGYYAARRPLPELGGQIFRSDVGGEERRQRLPVAMVDDHEQTLPHPLGGSLRPQVVQDQKVGVLDGIHPLVQVAARDHVRLAQVVQELGHGYEERRYPLSRHELVHHRDGEVGLAGAHVTAEVQPPPSLPVFLPVHDLVHDLGKSLLGALAKPVVEVVKRVALHALTETAALPEGRDAGLAAHQLPLAPVVLLLAFRGAGMVIPLSGLAVLLLKGRGKLYPLGLELPAAVRADLVVELERLRLAVLLIRRRATHSPPGVGQQIVDPLHPSPPSPLSSAPRPGRRRSPRPDEACGPSRSARRLRRSSRPARPNARGCSARSPPASRRARSRSSAPPGPRPHRAHRARSSRSGTPGCAVPARTP